MSLGSGRGVGGDEWLGGHVGVVGRLGTGRWVFGNGLIGSWGEVDGLLGSGRSGLAKTSVLLC